MMMQRILSLFAYYWLILRSFSWNTASSLRSTRSLAGQRVRESGQNVESQTESWHCLLCSRRASRHSPRVYWAPPFSSPAPVLWRLPLSIPHALSLRLTHERSGIIEMPSSSLTLTIPHALSLSLSENEKCRRFVYHISFWSSAARNLRLELISTLLFERDSLKCRSEMRHHLFISQCLSAVRQIERACGMKRRSLHSNRRNADPSRKSVMRKTEPLRVSWLQSGSIR